MKAKRESLVKTICRICGVGCGIDVFVEDGRIVKWAPMPEHENYYGGRCPKQKALADYEYSVDRLTHPLRRVSGGWKRISWTEAFSIIVEKLNEIKHRYGPEYLTVGYGHPGINSPLMWLVPRFCDAFGTPNIPVIGNYCYMPRAISEYITFGNHMLPDYDGSRCAVFWGCNRLESNPSINVVKRILGLKPKGVKIIVIDPRKTKLARMADYHLQVRPGTDGALALGMVNIIISEGLYDREFVGEWTTGFEDLKRAARSYTPEKVSEITRVPSETIVMASRTYATSKPATMDWGVGLDQHTNTFQTLRAISCLKAITGNVDKAGASTYIEPLPINLRIPGRQKRPVIGEKEYPIYYSEALRKGDTQEPCTAPLFDRILSGDIKAGIFMARNLVANEANTSKTIEALQKLELLVVMDLYLTETAQLAHIVLPAATFLEVNNLRTYHLGRTLSLICAVNKAVEPPGECMGDNDFILRLAKELGLEKDFPWKNTDELYDHMLSQVGTSLEYLRDHPEGFLWERREYESYRKKGFDTESGKVELCSKKLERHGFSAVPVFQETVEGPVSSPEVAKHYPLIITTGGKTRFYEHSQYRNIPRLRSRFPENIVEINPVDAGKYGVMDGDLVEVESPRGTIQVKARVTEDIMEGVVHIYHGWPGQSNVNRLTPDKPLDPISGSPSLNSFLCRVKSLHKRRP
ncbi:MAG: molybdopterin-dependent oxidoreductase [Deltaproteobacteria bacterium]|nr:molybdopterin-dependent oxidoreductase [Deltaproteobacteria bacterium]